MAEKNPPYPSSYTGGVKPMSIEGYFKTERRRLVENYTDEEREWRKKWLKDQELSANEPRRVPELELELKNPIRRFYRKPWDMIYEKLVPVTGEVNAIQIRWLGPKILMTIGGIYLAYYYLKYNANDWTRHNGWVVRTSKQAILPGDPNYPLPTDRHNPADYANRGFKERKVFLD
ncbi:NADH dehydrogenase [ubiquinone] 1 beta subcomplex subunit 6 [Centruroides vittatus]|uniref:NADH dehydrogenase [ubiquinone] 1 beta subcomplex subunit 6 n=1 Tax=Centruroides vittatus TaxID=120091 RepID=UPI00350F6CA0